MELIEVTCWRCGRTTAQAADWSGLQLCLDCSRLRAGLDVGYGVGAPIGTWHPTLARVLPGELGAPAAARERAARGPTHRIVVPMRQLRPEEVKRLPQLIKLKFELDLETLDYPGTYAMAEEIATATLVESVALRFTLADGRRGAALWWDWRWHGALLVGGGGRITWEHLVALVTGAPWPPPTEPCPACSLPVRRNRDQTIRAHGSKRGCKG